jgi:ring-1,2-phenylacetyl-CoA epoxidase subunit PaaE
VQHTLEIQPGKTILDLALQAKIDVPYSCQGGVCSSCIAKITHGKATMLSNQILTDSEVNDGLVLTCQAIPESAHVEVDYDDV